MNPIEKEKLYLEVYMATMLKASKVVSVGAKAAAEIVSLAESEPESKTLAVAQSKEVVLKAAKEVFKQLTAEAAGDPTAERFALASSAAEVYIVAEALQR